MPPKLQKNIQEKENNLKAWKGNQTLTADKKYSNFAHDYEVCIENALNNEGSSIDE